MSELEKKQSGEIYDSRDLELRALQNKAKDLMRVYNSLPADSLEERNHVLESLLGHLGRNTRINQPFYVDYGNNIFLDDNSFINLNCTLLDTGKISIGKNTLIGPDVKIYTAVHAKDGYERFWKEVDGKMAIKTWVRPVTIGDYVWIGGGAIILPGVTIGNHAVIGAGSVVNKSIPDRTIASGNPCTIKMMNDR